jgi:iron complex transport system substrate-binding protein
VVAIGGTVTEIVYALGAGASLVGVDTSSTYPEPATQLPQVGYQRRLSAEGVLSLQPSVVLATIEAGPPAALSQLQSAGVPLLFVPATVTVAGAQAKIRLIAQALGRTTQGELLVQRLNQEMAETTTIVSRQPSTPKVLFIYARGQGTMQVAGRDTAAAAMITLAGGVNAIEAYEGYKPLTAEAVVTAAPDVIVLPARGLDSVGGVKGLLTIPGITLTPAGQQQRIVALDDLYLLGFGPRTGQAVRELASFLHTSLPRSGP